MKNISIPNINAKKYKFDSFSHSCSQLKAEEHQSLQTKIDWMKHMRIVVITARRNIFFFSVRFFSVYVNSCIGKIQRKARRLQSRFLLVYTFHVLRERQFSTAQLFIYFSGFERLLIRFSSARIIVGSWITLAIISYTSSTKRKGENVSQRFLLSSLHYLSGMYIAISVSRKDCRRSTQALWGQ